MSITFDFVEAVSAQKQLTMTPLLPASGSTYGSVAIVDNVPPTITRQYTAENVTLTQLEAIITASLTRHRTFTITTSLGTTYTGRYISLSAQQTPGADDYQLTLVLQDMTFEAAGTSAVNYVIT